MLTHDQIKWKRFLARLSVRARNGLARGQIKSFEQLQKMSKEDLIRIPSLGRFTMLELIHAVKEFELQNAIEPAGSQPTKPEPIIILPKIKPPPYGGNVLQFVEAQLAAIPERERLIFLERQVASKTIFKALAQRFGVSTRRIFQLLKSAYRRLRQRLAHSVIRNAEKQLYESSKTYTPNSGGFPALDGPLEGIRKIAVPLRWIASRSSYAKLIFDDQSGAWSLSDKPQLVPSTPKNHLTPRSHIREWRIYIVRCSDDTFYTGISRNIEKRVRHHNSGSGARYTSTRCPVQLVYQEVTKRTLSDASRREIKIKGFSRVQKEKLIRHQLERRRSGL